MPLRKCLVFFTAALSISRFVFSWLARLVVVGTPGKHSFASPKTKVKAQGKRALSTLIANVTLRKAQA